MKIDELHTYQGSGRFCLPGGFISSQLYITPEQWLSQQAAQGKRRSSPQGPCSAGAQTTASDSLVVFFTENYRHFFGINPN